MGRLGQLVIVKLGGSLITNKDVPLSPNLRNIRNVARELSNAIGLEPSIRMVIIHGGGSFGHYFAKRFSIGTEFSEQYPAEGLARTSAAMIKLHSIVLEEFCRAGVYCATVLPVEIQNRKEDNISNSESLAKRVNAIFDNKLLPVTFGFVNISDGGSFIISGDRIALAIANTFSATRVVFAMDVDGIYPSANLKGQILTEVGRNNDGVKSFVKKYDVTGGIQAKIATGFSLSDLGADVFFLSGAKRGRLTQAIVGSNRVIATRIYSTEKAVRCS